MDLKHRKRRLIASAGAVMAVVTAGALHAQTTNQPAEEELLNEVVVTGSRIQNLGSQSPTPLTTVSVELIQQISPSALDDVMNQLPAFRANSGPNQVTRNAGAASIAQSLANLRGLGAQRTLLLVDGRRPVPTNTGGTTSTSIIPIGLVKRLDVVTGGASAAYGSDAVAGVLNVVLDDRFEGLRASLLGGIAEQGDNEEIGGSVAYGFSAMDERLRVIMGADYNKNDGVGNIYSRSWSRVEPGNSQNPLSFGAGRAAGTPAFGWANGVEFATQTIGGVINTATTNTGATSSVLNQLAFAPDASTFRLVRGPVLGNLMINSSSNPVATPLAQWNLKSPLDQGSSFARATFDMTDSTEAFIEGGFARSHVFTFSQFHQQPTLTVLASNPYLPTPVAALMATNNLASFTMGRVDSDWLGTSGNHHTSTIQGAGGFKGTVFDKFSWDASYGVGKSEINAKTYGTREANLAAAEFAVRNSSGNIVCGAVSANPNFAANRLTASLQPQFVQPGCVPLNPFGVGNMSQAAIDYVSGIQYTTNTMKRRDVAANISGPVFELPAGPLSVAVGAEMRWDELIQIADPLQIQGIYSNGNLRSYSGKDDVREGYLEVDVPLLKEKPFFESVNVNGAVRRTDYKTSGPVTTWKGGVVWKPTNALLLRATRSHDIRAPALSELYSVGGVGAQGSYVNPFNGQSGRLPQQALGNPNLRPETSETLSYGFTLEGQGSLSGARLSVDYFKIEVEDVIAAVAPNDALARCYAGITLFCSSITFDNTAFGIAKVVSQPFNQSLLETEGLDIELGYRHALSGLGIPGTIDATVFGTFLNHYKTTDIAGPTGVTLEYAGFQNSAPKWVVSAFLNYRLEPLTVGLQMRAFSHIRFSPLFRGPDQEGYNPSSTTSINKNTFGGQALFSFNAAYDLKFRDHKLQVFGNVNNLFDRHPPEFAIAAINLGGNPYDYVGRTYKLGVRLDL